jgi:hypothetical protein
MSAPRCCAALAVALTLLALTATGASGHPFHVSGDSARGSFARLVPNTGLFPNSRIRAADSVRMRAAGGTKDVAPRATLQHDAPDNHLPATSENVDLVGKVEMTERFGDVVEGQIADLSVHEGFAYLNSWAEETCTRGGVYIVDIRRPSRPREVGFLPALNGNYHGEGAHVVDIDTEHFDGDLLAVNNEYCADVDRGGGFDLYDVSDPRRPRVLVQGFGDFGGEGSLVGRQPAPGRALPPANSSHSTFVWEDEDSDRAYLVAQDNTELHDVDIFEITDPENPQPVAEHDLVALFPQIVDGSANGDEIFHHDMIVEEIRGTQTMISAYWDAGYVTMDVDDPANPVYLADSSYDGEDPLFGFNRPEGNGHQSEFSADDRFILAADEDFAPFRTASISVAGANAGTFPASSVGGGAPVAALPDGTLNGPVVYGGYGCDASAPVPARSGFDLGLAAGEEAIVVLQRGPEQDPSAPEAACFPGEKAANAAAAGWDAVLLVNRHLGDQASDAAFCGSGGYPPGLQFVTVCTTHEAFHRMFGAMPPQFGLPVPSTGEPAVGARGDRVTASAVFDGWGYAQLYRNTGGKLQHIDSYAVDEAQSEQFAVGFGDLSIHEFATDPDRRRAYISYYAAGVRVVDFGPRGIVEVGRHIDEGGNNFWGIEVVDGEDDMFAASDRDFGLFIYRYTGD